MSTFSLVMLAAAAVLVIAAEWQVLSRRLGPTGRRARERQRRKAGFRVVTPDRNETFAGDDDDDFVRAVERDLAALPTIDERD